MRWLVREWREMRADFDRAVLKVCEVTGLTPHIERLVDRLVQAMRSRR